MKHGNVLCCWKKKDCYHFIKNESKEEQIELLKYEYSQLVIEKIKNAKSPEDEVDIFLYNLDIFSSINFDEILQYFLYKENK